MKGPENLRVYGILLRERRVLMAAERVAGREVLKFPGGAVESGETPERALVREFREECALRITPLRLLHAPGTLFSPWTHTNYTPLYYQVKGAGAPRVPPEEPIEMRFMPAREAIACGKMAEPEIVALKRALERDD